MKKLIILIFLTAKLFGQDSLIKTDSTLSNSSLLNGREYIPSPFPVIGNSFYKNAETVENNSVKFDGVVYTKLPLLYDLKSDNLLSRRPGTLTYVILVRELVDYFTIGADTVVHLKQDKDGLKAGYYLQVFKSDKYVSYAKYTKSIKDPKALHEKRFYIETKGFFFKGSEQAVFTPYKNVNKIISLYKPHKKELKRRLRESDLNNSDDLSAKTVLVLSHLEKG